MVDIIIIYIYLKIIFIHYIYYINYKVMIYFDFFSYYFNLVLFKIDDDDNNHSL